MSASAETTLGPAMSLGAARLLCEQDLPNFADDRALRVALSNAVTPFTTEQEHCPAGILSFAKFLQRAGKERVMAVLMNRECRSTLGEIPGVVDTETPCDRDDFAKFLAGQL